MKVLIVNTKKSEFVSEKTGEVVEFCNTTIGRITEETDNFSGYVLEEITGKATDFNIIKGYVNKIVEVDLEYKKVDKKNYRAKIRKVGDTTL